MRLAGGLRSTGALVGYVGLSVLLFASAWRDPARISIGFGGDPELFMWLLGWTPFALTHGLNLLITDYLNYPGGANLMWNTAEVVPGLVLWPALAAFGPVVAFNALMTLALALSAWCAYLAIRMLVPDRAAAFAGGLLYGFSPYMLGHALGHPNFVICLLPALNLLLLTELLVRQRQAPLVTGGLLGMLGAAQLVTGEEILATTALIDALGVAILCALTVGKIRARLSHALQGLAAALVTFLILGAIPLGVQFLGPQRVLGDVRAPDFYVDDLLTFFLPSNLFLIAPDGALRHTLRWTGNVAEWNGYIGIPLTLLLLGIAVRGWSVLAIRWAAILAFVIAVCSMGPHLHVDGRVTNTPLPWALVQPLPIFRDILPARLMLYFFLLAGLALAHFIAELRRQQPSWRVAAGGLLVLLAALPLIPRLPWPSQERPLPAFFTQRAQLHRLPQGAVVLVAPFSTDPGVQAPAAQATATHPMYWQVAAGLPFRMPAGYMRVPGPAGEVLNGPPATTTSELIIRIQEGQTAPELTPELRDQIGADLARWRVAAVLVGPMQNQAEEVRLFSSLLGHEPERSGGVYIWWRTP